MALKSALDDVRETTLASVSGLLGKLRYLASLRRTQGRYQHWGMEIVHGPEPAQRALKTAHAEVITEVLRAPLASLEQDLQESSQRAGIGAQAYVTGLRERFEDLLPGEWGDSPAVHHLSSVLAALSSLEKHRGRATRSIS